MGRLASSIRMNFRKSSKGEGGECSRSGYFEKIESDERGHVSVFVFDFAFVLVFLFAVGFGFASCHIQSR